MKPRLYQWKQLSVKKEECEPLEVLLKEKGLPQNLAPLLWNRGIKDAEALQSFLYPNWDSLHSPLSMNDMEKGVTRVLSAIEKGQNILVYGDYDADGITSTAVMKEALDLLGANVTTYLPNRFTDGYGPNLAVFKHFIESGIELIITVDNGVSGHEAIAYAKEQGIDVIVTDHHELPAVLPAAYAIIHPRHPEGEYPFGDLAGVGVAFKFATALLGETPIELLDLVAIGTIADLVSLTDENRALVKLGLEIFKKSERIGLTALCQVANIEKDQITAENIGFALAPRLNALGRLGDANPGVELLTTFDEKLAQELAEFVQQKNEERQEIVKAITAEALQMITESEPHAIHVLAKEGWHEGVLGIVASRIVQETGKPALVLNLDPTAGIAKGSGRSVEMVNLFDTLNQKREWFTHFGGHHMAAGMTLPIENLETLQTYLDEYIESEKIDLTTAAQLNIEEKIAISDITLDFLAALSILEPFGTDNEAPLFLIESDQVHHVKQIGAQKDHLKFQVGKDFDCLAFGKGRDAAEFQTGLLTQVVGQLSVNEWNGRKKPQMIVTDYQVNGLQLFDFRGGKRKFFPKLTEAANYILFNEQNKELLMQAAERTCIGQEIEQLAVEDSIVLIDCPESLADLEKVIQKTQAHRIYLQCAVKEETYLEGMPSREHFALLFNVINQQKNIDVRNKLAQLAQYLKVSQALLIFMLQVFSELKFVTIEDGVINKVENPDPQPLTNSKIYQQRQSQIQAEEFLLYSDLKQLRDWMNQQEEET